MLGAVQLVEEKINGGNPAVSGNVKPVPAYGGASPERPDTHWTRPLASLAVDSGRLEATAGEFRGERPRRAPGGSSTAARSTRRTSVSSPCLLLSPLQYQKQLRLQEARRLLRSELRDVGTVSRAVGYESSSQFSREYRRL